jgi:hypothetical protein
MKQKLSNRVEVVLLALVFLAAAAHDVRADANTIAIDSVTIAANQLTFQGTFGSGAVTVLLGSKSLPIVSSSPSQIVAVLNPIPHIGTYSLTLMVGNKTATISAGVSAKTLEGIVFADGSVVGTPSGFVVTHAFTGHYRINFPAGTFQIGSPYVFPPALVTPLFAAGSPNINYYVVYGDQSGLFEVDFGGVDTAFSFNLTQTY